MVGKFSGADQKVRKTIGWYNNKGNLKSPIMYNKVASLLAQVGPKRAGMILKALEGKETQVQNPTAWIAKAALKAGANGRQGVMAIRKNANLGKLGKTIMWYNKNSRLRSQIQYKEVAPLLSQLDTRKAGQILKSLEGKEGQVQNPTAWLKTAAKKAGAGEANWSAKSGARGGRTDSRLGKVIGWFNKQGKLQNQIHYKTVAPILGSLPLAKALGIVNALEGKERAIKDPTAWICTAALRATQ